MIATRLSTHGDAAFLAPMFAEAALWRPEWPRLELDELLARPGLERYFRDWGRPGDLALIAVREDGAAAGAAWWRTFSAREPGYGFVSEDIPELGIAVEPSWRGRGIGSILLRDLQEAARVRGIRGLSLSVHRENAALRLYERAGFVQVSADGDALTMLWV